MSICRKGAPATRAIDFGRSTRTGRKRVPRPPQRIKAAVPLGSTGEWKSMPGVGLQLAVDDGRPVLWRSISQRVKNLFARAIGNGRKLVENLQGGDSNLLALGRGASQRSSGGLLAKALESGRRLGGGRVPELGPSATSAKVGSSVEESAIQSFLENRATAEGTRRSGRYRVVLERATGC